MCSKIFIVVFCAAFARNVMGHGMMLEPPNRSSMWRYYNSSPTNYDDNANFCGGRAVQWEDFGGKCGVCGDKFSDPHPQANENTGYYGRGLVTRTYESGGKIDVIVQLTSNHLGNFKYSLCILEDSTKPESGEECFRGLLLADGSAQYNVSATDDFVRNTLILPQGVKCERCVLRWHYTAGNSWGVCSDGNGANGCGPQETFRSCSDISIV